MPLVVVCPECAKRFRVLDEFAGKRIKCPHCKAAQVAKAEASKSAVVDRPVKSTNPAPAKPAAPENAFSFVYDPPGDEDVRESPRRSRTRDDDDEDEDEDEEYERPRAKTSRKKSPLDNIASGTRGILLACVVLAIAAALLVFGPQGLDLKWTALEDLPTMLNLLIAAVSLIVIASIVAAFGHIAAGRAPEAAANRLALFSLLLSGLSILLWIAFLGVLIYIRLKHQEFAVNLKEQYTLFRIWAVLFSAAVASSITTELLFAMLLRRCGLLVRVRRLQLAAQFQIILFWLALAADGVAFVGLVVKTLFFDLTEIAVVEAFLTALSKDELTNKLAVLGALLGLIGCYGIVLLMGKSILRRAVEIHKIPDEDEEDEEDDDEDYRKRSRYRQRGR